MNKLNVAIIGLGRIASLLEDDTRREKPCTHAGAVRANPDCILMGGMDTNEKRRRLFAERWNVPVFANAGAMLQELKPDIVTIATEPDSHTEYCQLAAGLGVSVLVCEKPLSDSLNGAQRIAALLKKNSKILVNHERRYSNEYIKAQALIAEKRLGTLLSVHARIYFGQKRRLVNMLWDDATHLVDAIRFLCGAQIKHGMTWGTALTEKKGTAYLLSTLHKEDDSDVPCCIEVGAERDYLVFEIALSFSEGRLRIGNGVWELWESGPCPYADNFKALAQSADTFSGKSDYFANMIADAVLCARNPARTPRSSVLDAYAVIEYLTAVKPL
ncbi:oxidoreductase [Spirochaetia bacterium]|nr:oxidoreductase [Spirochaetia bacterium]